MPQMGESIAEGTLSRWLKKVGDAVKRDEPMFEISTDKVDAEIPAPSTGVLAEILVTEGQTVPVQTVVARLETDVTAGGPGTPPPPRGPAPARGSSRGGRRGGGAVLRRPGLRGGRGGGGVPAGGAPPENTPRPNPPLPTTQPPPARPQPRTRTATRWRTASARSPPPSSAAWLPIMASS